MDSEIGTTPGQANPSPSRITRKNGLFGLGFAWLVGCEPGTADDCFFVTGVQTNIREMQDICLSPELTLSELSVFLDFLIT